MIKGKPVHAETVHINHPQASYGIFCFNEQGDLFVNSDYGFYGYAWRSYGDNFRDFLAGTNADYMVGKFETNFIEVSGKRSLPGFRKEKLIILCAEFIKTLKEQAQPVTKQELVTRLYNLVNAVNNLTGSFDASTTPAVDFALTEARETLSKDH